MIDRWSSWALGAKNWKALKGVWGRYFASNSGNRLRTSCGISAKSLSPAGSRSSSMRKSLVCRRFPSGRTGTRIRGVARMSPRCHGTRSCLDHLGFRVGKQKAYFLDILSLATKLLDVMVQDPGEQQGHNLVACQLREIFSM